MHLVQEVLQFIPWGSQINKHNGRYRIHLIFGFQKISYVPNNLQKYLLKFSDYPTRKTAEQLLLCPLLTLVDNRRYFESTCVYVDQKNVPKLFTYIETNPFLYLSCVFENQKDPGIHALQLRFNLDYMRFIPSFNRSRISVKKVFYANISQNDVYYNFINYNINNTYS